MGLPGPPRRHYAVIVGPIGTLPPRAHARRRRRHQLRRRLPRARPRRARLHPAAHRAGGRGRHRGRDLRGRLAPLGRRPRGPAAVAARHRAAGARQRPPHVVPREQGGGPGGRGAPEWAPEPGEAIAEAEAVRAALSRLSPVDRETLMLVAWEELDPAAAARAAGCSRPTFAVRLHRARRRLAGELAALDAPHRPPTTEVVT